MKKKMNLLLCFMGIILLTRATLVAPATTITPAARAANSNNLQALTAPNQCTPLPAPSGNIINISTVNDLVAHINSANPGDTLLLADGNYALNGAYLRIDTPNVTVRSASGDREAVILDGNYQTTEIFQIVASEVTIADLTLREAVYHPIHISTNGNSHTLNTLIYNVHIIDPGQQAIKINPNGESYYTDDGVIACSHIELTDAGRAQVWAINNSCYTGGVDMHQGQGWTIRDNLIEGFWCPNDLSEHGIHLWRGCRDSIIERNILNDNARGIGLGLVTSGSGRIYPDNPCPTTNGYVDDFGGLIRNNFISANDSSLFASEFGFDCGICLWNACNAQALHNTIYTANPGRTYSSIEWRFENTQAIITNNLVNDSMNERDRASAIQNGNVTEALVSWFEDAANGDLHLTSTATGAIDQVTAPNEVSDDVDGDSRPLGSAADVGADEYGLPSPARVIDLHVTNAVNITSTETVSITLGWTAPAGAELQAIHYANTPISEANWASATPLIDELQGNASTYSAVLSFSGETLYFAHKSYNADGGWSQLSNNAFWPHLDVYLPIIQR